jgi:hypothetical protein
MILSAMNYLLYILAWILTWSLNLLRGRLLRKNITRTHIYLLGYVIFNYFKSKKKDIYHELMILSAMNYLLYILAWILTIC